MNFETPHARKSAVLATATSKPTARGLRACLSSSLLAVTLAVGCGAAPEAVEGEAEGGENVALQTAELQRVDEIGVLLPDESALDDGQPTEERLDDSWGLYLCNKDCVSRYSGDALDACAEYCACAFDSDEDWVRCWVAPPADSSARC